MIQVLIDLTTRSNIPGLLSISIYMLKGQVMATLPITSASKKEEKIFSSSLATPSKVSSGFAEQTAFDVLELTCFIFSANHAMVILKCFDVFGASTIFFHKTSLFY